MVGLFERGGIASCNIQSRAGIRSALDSFAVGGRCWLNEISKPYIHIGRVMVDVNLQGRL